MADANDTTNLSRRAMLGRIPAAAIATTFVLPEAAVSAVAPTPEIIEAYKSWLHQELAWLTWDMAADPVFQKSYGHYPGAKESRSALADQIKRSVFHVGDTDKFHRHDTTSSTYMRAALVLNTVGCNWRESED